MLLSQGARRGGGGGGGRGRGGIGPHLGGLLRACLRGSGGSCLGFILGFILLVVFVFILVFLWGERGKEERGKGKQSVDNVGCGYTESQVGRGMELHNTST